MRFRHFCCVILDKNPVPISLPPFTLVEMYPVKTHVSKSVLPLTPSDLKFYESSLLSTKVCCRGKIRLGSEKVSQIFGRYSATHVHPQHQRLYTHKHAYDQTKRTQGCDKRQKSSKTQQNPDSQRLYYHHLFTPTDQLESYELQWGERDV